MNYRGLKQAARQCLRDSACHPQRLTALYVLAEVGLGLLLSGRLLALQTSALRSGGSSFDTLTAYARVNAWVSIAELAVMLLSVLWSAGYVSFALRLSRGQTVRFGDFAAGFRRPGRVLAVMLLEALAIFLWSLLLVVPGIVAAYRYRMAVWIVMDDPEVTALQALAISSRLTYGHKGELLMLDLHFLWYHLPLFLTSALLTLQAYGLLPVAALEGQRGAMILSGLDLAVTLLLSLTALAYVQTTGAHAYNWLRSLDRARREEIRGYRPGGGAW